MRLVLDASAVVELLTLTPKGVEIADRIFAGGELSTLPIFSTSRSPR